MSMMNYDDAIAFQRREEGDDSPIPISFTASELDEHFHDNPDDDGSILMEVMDRDMHDRSNYWERRARNAEAALAARDEDC